MSASSARTSSSVRRTSSSARTAAWSPADADVLAELRPDKLLPSPDTVPERFELGTLPYELMAGTTQRSTSSPDDGPRHPSRRLVAAMSALAASRGRAARRIEAGLQRLSSVTVHSTGRAPDADAAAHVRGPRARDDHRSAGPTRHQRAGRFVYAYEASKVLGLGAAGGVRIGLAPYNDADRRRPTRACRRERNIREKADAAKG